MFEQSAYFIDSATPGVRSSCPSSGMTCERVLHSGCRDTGSYFLYFLPKPVPDFASQYGKGIPAL